MSKKKQFWQKVPGVNGLTVGLYWIPFLKWLNLNINYLHYSAEPLAWVQAPVVQNVDNAIHRINHYPADSVVCFVKTYALDSELSSE